MDILQRLSLRAFAMPAVCALMFVAGGASLHATPYNIAPQGRATASSEKGAGFVAGNINDGNARIEGSGAWQSTSTTTFWGQIDYPWVQIEWNTPVWVDKVVVYDLPEPGRHVAGGVLHFSDGSRVDVDEIANDGSPRVVEFAARQTEWIKFEVTDGDGDGLGLSEIEVYPAPESYADYVSWVNPYVETARGRYFYFITGNQPYGMIGAAPLTRNKNQYGGGYNYNSTEVLGFPQIHCWMLSGLVMMPTTGDVSPCLGEQGWKSPFTHAGEEVQPGYHRLYLERYGLWVEQTATERVSFYRLTSSADADAHVLFNLGGYVGTSTMVNAQVERVSDTEIAGSFDTRGRLWGGPDNVRIFFVARFDKPFASLDGWAGDEFKSDITSLQGTTECIPRNEGMSYSDAPTSGVSANYRLRAGEQLHVKMAVSYVSVENARANMEAECQHWNFDQVRAASQQEWNEWLGRIDVKGGSADQKMKFYTDLWHVLLGRHKIDDCNGEYPDYTKGGERHGNYLHGAQLSVGKLAMGDDGEPVHHMYNFDSLWLTQWNLNTLWELAYPDVIDDFAACLLQYDANGGLLPRGPCAGAYSYIMYGCPATSLITSAYQRGISRKWSPKEAFEAMKRNHAVGGMLAHDMDDELKFYIENGYCPGNAGLTIQWTFEDWALGEMAQKMGKRRDADYYHKRASRWQGSFNSEVGLMLPRGKDGQWLHTNPLSGDGYIEANAWQATFGLSHAIPQLADLMGGNDSLCARLNYAFEMAAPLDFVYGYGGGYVSYANQPGLSNAHVFSHAGKPWLTQYWVRRVKQQAYGSVSPGRGYGGHDEDQGQMGGVSALMAIGLFSIDGGSNSTPTYDITSPVFDEVTIKLHPDYCTGKEFRITTHGNSAENCYIQRATLNGIDHNHTFSINHSDIAAGGKLELWLDNTPNKSWGTPTN